MSSRRQAMAMIVVMSTSAPFFMVAPLARTGHADAPDPFCSTCGRTARPNPLWISPS